MKFSKQDVSAGSVRIHGDILRRMRVLEVATPKIVTVGINAEINEIASILGKKQIKIVPVECNGVLVGIISRGDVILSIAKCRHKRESCKNQPHNSGL
jgi:predicted transcriptional regulator